MKRPGLITFVLVFFCATSIFSNHRLSLFQDYTNTVNTLLRNKDQEISYQAEIISNQNLLVIEYSNTINIINDEHKKTRKNLNFTRAGLVGTIVIIIIKFIFLGK